MDANLISNDNMASLKQIAMVEMLDYCMMCSFLDRRLSGSRVRMINATFNIHMDSMEMEEYLKESWKSFWSECPATFDALLILDRLGLEKAQDKDKSLWGVYYRYLLLAHSCIDAAGEDNGEEQNSNMPTIVDYLAMLIGRVKEVGLSIPADLKNIF